MEPHIHALEIVCKHFKQEYGTEAMVKLRREKNCLASQNYRLRKKIDLLNVQIDDLMARNDRMFIVYRKFVMQVNRARESLAVVSPYV